MPWILKFFAVRHAERGPDVPTRGPFVKVSFIFERREAPVTILMDGVASEKPIASQTPGLSANARTLAPTSTSASGFTQVLEHGISNFLSRSGVGPHLWWHGDKNEAKPSCKDHCACALCALILLDVLFFEYLSAKTYISRLKT